MADLKVTLQFNDENATSFTYDKLNGLKSFSFFNEGKSDDESIDYSVKSNTGSLRAIDINKDLYTFLLSKPKYDTIFVVITLDTKSLGSFINSGKIEYDNNTQELNLNFQNNIVLLQSKKYKMQIDKRRVGNTTLLDILNQLITLASGLIGQEFEIDSATQTYLGSVNVQYPYLEEASVWEQLNKLCVAGQLSIYPSGTKIKVERWV